MLTRVSLQPEALAYGAGNGQCQSMSPCLCPALHLAT